MRQVCLLSETALHFDLRPIWVTVTLLPPIAAEQRAQAALRRQGPARGLPLSHRTISPVGALTIGCVLPLAEFRKADALAARIAKLRQGLPTLPVILRIGPKGSTTAEFNFEEQLRLGLQVLPPRLSDHVRLAADLGRVLSSPVPLTGANIAAVLNSWDVVFSAHQREDLSAGVLVHEAAQFPPSIFTNGHLRAVVVAPASPAGGPGTADAAEVFTGTVSRAHELWSGEIPLRRETRQAYKVRMDALRDILTLFGKILRVTGVRFNFRYTRTTEVLDAHPIVSRIYKKACEIHGVDRTGHDYSHIKRAVNRAVHFSDLCNNRGLTNNVRIVAAAEAVHDLMEVDPELGRDKHTSPEAIRRIRAFLEKMNREAVEEARERARNSGKKFRKKDVDVLSEKEIKTILRCVRKHSYKVNDPRSIEQLRTTEERIVFLADKSDGSGFNGMLRTMLFGVENRRDFMGDGNGTKGESTIDYMPKEQTTYPDKVGHWEEFKAVRHIIEKQVRAVSEFAAALEQENTLPEHIRNAIGKESMAKIGGVYQALKTAMADHLNDFIHFSRCMHAALEIAYENNEKVARDGAFGIAQNIFDAGRKGQDLETSFWNVTQHMLEILARLRNIKSISGQRVATRHIDYTLAFINGIISEWTETFDAKMARSALAPAAA